MEILGRDDYSIPKSVYTISRIAPISVEGRIMEWDFTIPTNSYLLGATLNVLQGASTAEYSFNLVCYSLINFDSFQMIMPAQETPGNGLVYKYKNPRFLIPSGMGFWVSFTGRITSSIVFGAVFIFSVGAEDSALT